MIRSLAVAALVAMLALSGCGGVPAMVIGGLGSAGSVYTALDKIAAATEPYIATACAEYEKGKAAADALAGAGRLPGTISAQVGAIESFGDAACANPPSGDPLATAIWLGRLAGQITTLATSTK